MLTNCLAACTHLSSTVSQLFELQVQKIAVFKYRSPHFFVSHGNAPGAITINITWIEREFDAYKLPRCMCPSNYNRFWVRARYLWKISSFYHTPLHSTPPLGRFPPEHRHPVWYGKPEWCGYQMVKKFRRYLYSFWRNSRTWRTDGHQVTAYTALMHMHPAVKI